ncbi:putative lipase [Streptomyces sp. NBRC 110611]|nr:putative lipase [Streptomyces sp. NBRC 110611]
MNILKGGRVSSTGCFRSSSDFCPVGAATAGLLRFLLRLKGAGEAVTEVLPGGAWCEEPLVSGAR